MTDFNDDFEPDFGDDFESNEPNENEEMLFAIIKQAKDQQTTVNALIERLGDLATTLQDNEQEREKRLNNALDGLKNLDLNSIVSDSTKKAISELITTELKKDVAEFVRVQNLELQTNSRIVAKNNNILIDNINSFANVIDNLKKDESEVLTKQVSKQVEKGVFEGVANGLKDVTASINGYLENVGDAVSEGANKLIRASNKSGEVLDTITDYQERVINRKHWILIAFMAGFFMLATPLLIFVSYKTAMSKMPSDDEIAQAQMQLKSLKDQNQYLQQALTTTQYTWKDSNLYYKVDKSKCIDYNNQNYCMKQ